MISLFRSKLKTRNKGYFISLFDNKEEAEKFLPIIKEIMEDEEIEKISQNIKADKHAFLNHNIEIKGRQFDIMIAHYLIEPEMQHRLDSLSNSYLEYETMLQEKVFGKIPKSGDKNLECLDRKKLKEYTVEKSDISLQLKPFLEEKLIENNQIQLFEDIEMPLVDVLVSMEREGVRIDIDQLHEFSQELELVKKRLEKEIFEDAGEEFSVSSPKQLSEILFQKLKIAEKTKKSSKTKHLSTSEDVLSKLIDKHPIVSRVLEYRSLTKLKGTYVDGVPVKEMKLFQ